MYSQKPKLHERQKGHIQGNLRTIALDVTPKCNMSCNHCYAEPFAHVKPIELDILEKALDEAYEMGVYHYVLQGGEPVIDFERLEAILKIIHPDETYINIVSNGWNMSLKNIKKLKELKVDKFTFSLDSGIEEEHDLGRMRGSYRRVIEAIDNVLAEGLLASISTVVTHESLCSQGFKKAYDIAESKGIRVDVQIAMPVGKWDGRREFLITPEDAQYIKSLQNTCVILPNGQKMINRDVYSGSFDHCPAGTEFMGITADGNLLPCNFIQCSLGNIKDNSINEMRKDLLTSHWFNGNQRVCICGEDNEYIDRFVVPYINKSKPLNAYEVFNLKRG